MKASGTYVAIAALSAAVNARNIIRADPEPTFAVALAEDGVTPRPTQAPEFDLLRRADASGTMLYAPDNTCGYISGRQGAGYTCYGTATCALSYSGSTGHVACCASSSCNMRYSCVDYAGYYSSSKCDDGCAIDIFTLKCTQSSAPYCNTISFSGGITDYWCNSREISTAQTANTTYSDGPARAYSTLDSSSSAVTIVTSGSVTQPTVTVHATNSESSATTSSSSSDDDGGSKTPVGPIVGGVVGGVGGLALIGAAIFFFLRNKKKKEGAAAAAATTTPPAYQSPPVMQQQPGTGPGGYNPVPQNNAGFYDPKNPYPSPATQYNSPTAPGGFYQPGTPDPSQIDPRLAAASTSPTPSYNQQTGQPGYPQQNIGVQPGFQPQQAVIHEAPANAPGTTGRGETHELA